MSDRSCEVPGCDRPYLAHGLCRLHYNRRRKGMPLIQERPEVGSPSGVGHYGVLDDDGDTVMCHECGKRRRALAAHLSRDHEMTVREYKIKHGLPLTKGLVSADYSAALSANARAQIGTPAWQRLEAARDPEAASHARDASTFRAPALVRVNAEKARQLSEKNRGPESVPCITCGAPIPKQVGRAPRQLCDLCFDVARGRYAREHWAKTEAERGARDAAITARWLAGDSSTIIGREYGISNVRVGQLTRAWRDELRRRGLHPHLEDDPALAGQEARAKLARLARPWWEQVWDRLPGSAPDREHLRAVVEHVTRGEGLTTLPAEHRTWVTSLAHNEPTHAPSATRVLDRLVADWRPIAAALPVSAEAAYDSDTSGREPAH